MGPAVILSLSPPPPRPLKRVKAHQEEDLTARAGFYGRRRSPSLPVTVPRSKTPDPHKPYADSTLAENQRGREAKSRPAQPCAARGSGRRFLIPPRRRRAARARRLHSGWLSGQMQPGERTRLHDLGGTAR